LLRHLLRPRLLMLSLVTPKRAENTETATDLDTMTGLEATKILEMRPSGLRRKRATTEQSESNRTGQRTET
jgi:hypothetical protein